MSPPSWAISAVSDSCVFLFSEPLRTITNDLQYWFSQVYSSREYQVWTLVLNLLDQQLAIQMNVLFFKVIIYYNDTAIA